MDREKLIAPFFDVRCDPYAKVRQWKDAHKGKKIIAHLLPDVPEEIIYASGAFPIPVLATDRARDISHVHLPSFTCELIREPLEMALNNELEFMDGMIIPYVCDSTRAFSQVWELNFPGLFNYTFWIPKRPDGVTRKRFLLHEMVRLKNNLEVFLEHEIADTDLRQSIRIYNLNRKLLRQLHQMKVRSHSTINNSDYRAIMTASMLMPKEQSNQMLQMLLENLRTTTRCYEERTEKKHVRVFLFGSLCESSLFFEYIDKAGIDVVDDNLYNGTRYFLVDVDEGADPMESLVNRHFAKDPMSCFHFPRTQWERHIRERVEKSEIEGFLFINLKYCEPMEFDYPLIKEVLQELDVPSLFLEVEFSSGSLAQIQTRLEAFAEMLRVRKYGDI